MTELTTPAAPRRLFNALFPPPEACAAIAAARQRWPGLPRRLHPVPERMHLTLQFFSQVDAPHERDWLAALQAVRFEPFEITLTQAELWQAPSGVIAVLVPEPTRKLVALRHATSQLARQAGLPAATSGFRPHLTTLRRAERLIGLYEQAGIGRERVLIKIASTWEGIRAAEQLEKAGIQTNLTLLFSFAQAVACAEAGVFLISPFVGRIYDWYKKAEGRDFVGAEDPGVKSVSRIYQYYKANGYDTVVMGASFRNLGQIEQLAGCDRLTISPELLQQLADDQGQLPRILTTGTGEARQALDESAFRWAMNEDAMATEKLAEGIRLFARDQEKLEALLAARR